MTDGMVRKITKTPDGTKTTLKVLRLNENVLRPRTCTELSWMLRGCTPPALGTEWTKSYNRVIAEGTHSNSHNGGGIMAVMRRGKNNSDKTKQGTVLAGATV